MSAEILRNRQSARNAARASLLLWALLFLGGCAVEETPEPGHEGDSGATPQPVVGGSAVVRVGVVAVTPPMGRGTECTGVLLNQNTVVTAGHCVSSVSGGQTKSAVLSVVYQRRDRSSICLTGGEVLIIPDRNPYCQAFDNYEVSVYPGYVLGSSDASKDLAVLKSKRAFMGVTQADFAYIDVSPLSEDGRLEFYGYGMGGASGGGAGFLRVGAGEINAVNAHHINLDAGGARICLGDSGGPATHYFSRTSPELHVLGISANVSGNVATCAADGALERFSYLAPKLTWIEQRAGITCSRFTSSKTNRSVARCF